MNSGKWNSISFILIVSIWFSSQSMAEIFDGKKKLFLYNTDSHSCGASVPLFLEKAGVDYIEVSKLSGVKTRHFPIGVSKEGETGFQYLKQASDGAWFAGLENTLKTHRNSCNGCPLIVGLYGHAVYRSHSETGKGLFGWDSFTIGDTNNVAEVDRAVGWMKTLADQIRAKGADYVIFSSGVLSYSRARLPEHTSILARKFNNKYIKDGYYFHDNVGYVNQDPKHRMGGDLDHPMRVGLGGNSFPYSSRGFFEGMLKIDGQDYPSWWGDLEKEKYDKAKEEVARVQYNGPLKGMYKLGDKIKFTYEVDCVHDLKSVDIVLNFVRRDNELNSDFSRSSKISLTNSKQRCPMGATAGPGYEGLCCGEDLPSKNIKWGEFELTVTQDLMRKLVGKQKGLDRLGKSGLPVYLQIMQPGKYYMARRDYTNIDWQNPKDMIVLFNADEIPANPTVYPTGFGETISTNLNVEAMERIQILPNSLMKWNQGVGVSWEIQNYEVKVNGSRIQIK